jgi:Transglycosylase-like domain/Putative peptidoglycan binding domain
VVPMETDAPVNDRMRAPRLRWLALAASLLALCALGAGAAFAGSTGGTSPESASADRETVGSSIVKRVQRKLGVRPVSGHYGPITRRAVRRFQKRRGLGVDGVLGAATLRALGLRPETGEAGEDTGSSVQLPAVLRRIAQCESGGNPRAVSANGMYRGKYQFSRATWRSVGGTGDPAAAPEAEQDRLALRLYRREGTSPWPNCA